MALRFVDSYDHYLTADLLQKWSAYTQAGSIAIQGGGGRHGTSGLRTNSTNAPSITKYLTSQATWIVGEAIYFESVGATSSNSRLIEFLDGTNSQFYVELDTAARIRAVRGPSTVLETGTWIPTSAIWYFIEYKVTIDNAGSWEVRVNGTPVLSGSGDTYNTGNVSAERIALWNGGYHGNILRDDLYICDGSGAAPTNTFLGDSRVECLLPSGNGNSSQFDGSDGNQVDNYALVDEASPNDSDYVESPDVGDKDTYAYGDLASTSGTVYGVQPVPRIRKTTAGSRTAVSVARLGVTEVDSANKMVLDSIVYSPDIRETKPGGGAWTISDVNSAEFGIKVTA